MPTAILDCRVDVIDCLQPETCLNGDHIAKTACEHGHLEGNFTGIQTAFEIRHMVSAADWDVKMYPVFGQRGRIVELSSHALWRNRTCEPRRLSQLVLGAICFRGMVEGEMEIGRGWIRDNCAFGVISPV
jgi:hypothetical protein